MPSQLKAKLNMSSDAPIGVFDSGLGGLSVLREIHCLLPNEALCYVADSQYAPYGDQSTAVVRQRSHTCCEHLLAEGVKAIVVACNTATASAVIQLRAAYDLPIIAMEPAVKPAVQLSSSGRIGVLATAGTLSSAKYEVLLKQHASDVTVISQPCLGLVEEIEKGDFNSATLRRLLRQYIEPLLQADIDTLILGCTHYPLVVSLIAELVGENVAIVDSGSAVARRVQQQLQEHQLSNSQQPVQHLRCWSSGSLKRQWPLLQKVWQAPIKLQKLTR